MYPLLFILCWKGRRKGIVVFSSFFYWEDYYLWDVKHWTWSLSVKKKKQKIYIFQSFIKKWCPPSLFFFGFYISPHLHMYLYLASVGIEGLSLSDICLFPTVSTMTLTCINKFLRIFHARNFGRAKIIEDNYVFVIS